MENDTLERNKLIKKGTMLAFIFAILVMGGGQLMKGGLSYLGQTICMIIGVVIVLRSSFKPEKGTLLAEKKKMDGISFVVILGAFMLAKLVMVVLATVVLNPLIKNGNVDAMENITSIEDNMFWAFLFLGIVTPIGEEIVFRGCIGNTYKKYGIWFATIMSTLLFALYHGNVLQLFSTFLLGIVMFYVAMNYSLKWSILLHFINNGVLSVGGIALRGAFPDNFLANNGEYILEVILLIAGLLLMKKDRAVEKVKAFLSGPANEKGVYGAAMKNIWFVLLVLLGIVISLMLAAMIAGVVSLPVAA